MTKAKHDNLDKLPSGKWRLRYTIQGKRYSELFARKPTPLEIKLTKEELQRKHESTIGVPDDTYDSVYNLYIASRTNSVSPSTIKGYESVHRNTPDWFKKMKISDIEPRHLQKVINDYSETRSPKSTRNLYQLMRAVICSFRPSFLPKITLPERSKKEPHIPEKDDVKAILDALRGDWMELPVLLAAHGLRRSEVCALQVEDLVEDDEGYSVRITKGMVQDKDKNWVIKDMPKNRSSVRSVHVTDRTAELIQQVGSGLVYRGYPGSIGKALQRVEKQLGIERFSLHKLRHYFASQMHELGATDAEVVAAGGWSTDHIMKDVYRHANRKKVSEGMTKYTDTLEKLTGGDRNETTEVDEDR